MSSTVVLTARFSTAVDYACRLHTETRKSTRVPYMAHLLGVTALVLGENGYLSFPVTEDIAIAALLHDAAEDKGGEERLRDIHARFGPNVERIVRGCSDAILPLGQEKPEWRRRKEAYILALSHHGPDVHLVSAADKLYNARAILEDYRIVGHDVWQRFKRGRDDQLWYFTALIEALTRSGSNRLVEELRRTVHTLTELSASPHPPPRPA